MFRILEYYFSKILGRLRGRCIRSVVMGLDTKIEPGCVVIDSVIKRHSYIGYNCTAFNAVIGSFCSIANHVSIGGAMHPMHFISTSPVFLSHRDSVKAKFSYHDYLPQIQTTIASDVWIGEGVFIKAGVTIGTGAVIGMGSVLTRDVPPYAIFGGNPARLIRYRFDDETIRGLLASQWWEWPDEKLKKYGKYINDPKLFLAKIQGDQS